MLNIILKALQQLLNFLFHQWGILVKKVGKHTANTLLIYITIGFLFEVFWLTLLLSVIILINFLN